MNVVQYNEGQWRADSTCLRKEQVQTGKAVDRGVSLFLGGLEGQVELPEHSGKRHED